MTANTLFPGRPDYTGPASGIFGLLHHEVLVESSHNVMERVEYVKNNKPANEVATRLHNMIYLGGCPEAADYEAKRAALYADYRAKRAPLDADYEAKLAALDAPILAYIRQHIPDCAWDEAGQTLVFPGETP